MLAPDEVWYFEVQLVDYFRGPFRERGPRARLWKGNQPPLLWHKLDSQSKFRVIQDELFDYDIDWRYQRYLDSACYHSGVLPIQNPDIRLYPKLPLGQGGFDFLLQVEELLRHYRHQQILPTKCVVTTQMRGPSLFCTIRLHSWKTVPGIEFLRECTWVQCCQRYDSWESELLPIVGLQESTDRLLAISDKSDPTTSSHLDLWASWMDVQEVRPHLTRLRFCAATGRLCVIHGDQLHIGDRVFSAEDDGQWREELQLRHGKSSPLVDTSIWTPLNHKFSYYDGRVLVRRYQVEDRWQFSLAGGGPLEDVWSLQFPPQSPKSWGLTIGDPLDKVTNLCGSAEFLHEQEDLTVLLWDPWPPVDGWLPGARLRVVLQNGLVSMVRGDQASMGSRNLLYNLQAIPTPGYHIRGENPLAPFMTHFRGTKRAGPDAYFYCADFGLGLWVYPDGQVQWALGECAPPRLGYDPDYP